MTTESSTHTKYKKGKIYEIPLDQLIRDTNQPRKHFDLLELEALKNSIDDKGLLYPIIFRVDENDSNVIVSGERRFKACQALGKEKIPAMLVDSEKYDEVAVIDNIQRVDLHPVDEAEALFNLKNKYTYTEKEIGNIIGKAFNTVNEIITLTKLSQEIRDDARTRKDLSRSALLKIARMKKTAAQKKAYDVLVASLSAPKKEIKRARLSTTKKTITSTDNTLKCIKELNLDTLGDDRDSVVAKLQELLLEIQNKLSATVS
jgi:ParB family transcriptional regulator, chromosome partitioning protein